MDTPVRVKITRLIKTPSRAAGLPCAAHSQSSSKILSAETAARAVKYVSGFVAIEKRKDVCEEDGERAEN